MLRSPLFPIFLGLIILVTTVPVMAQLVVLPAPRLLTTLPMGGKAGSTLEVTIAGENLEDVSELLFSSPKLTAKPAKDAEGKIVENQFVVSIAADTPVGVYDARVFSRLGLSSARAFSVSDLDEITCTVANDSLETAFQLKPDSICNAVMKRRAVAFFSFEGKQGQRYAVDCAATGIDSKLTPVVIIADASGADLVVNRTGGVIEFTPPADGSFVIKVNDLTYQGGERHFYRLALRRLEGDAVSSPQPSTTTVSGVSWPPVRLPAQAAFSEVEPNNKPEEAQKVTLPLDLSGSFYPAADVDTFEFEAKKGEVWWVEVASERLGCPTDPFVLVQKVSKSGQGETLTDVAELYDIVSPVKVSSNGYSYDGPPYNVGSPDVLGKVEIKEDGVHRLQVRDLFGGTRNDPQNVYRLIVRKAQPDFALAAWAVHMTLRNGDRAAFSKPIALRAGATMVLEVVAVRRDGFEGEIELMMEGLPAGVSASGLKIPAGKSVGHVVISAEPGAKRGHSLANLSGRAVIDGKTVTRACRLASMAWPVKDAKQEIPSPRLFADIPVSVSDSELSPLTITAAEEKVWEVEEGGTLKIPLKMDWHSDFSGTGIKLKAYGTGFDGLKEFEIPLKTNETEVVLDLAALKTPPGEYTIAFYGSAVAKYSYNPAAVKVAEEEQKKVEAMVAAVAAEAKKLANDVENAPSDKKSEIANAAKIAADKQKQAETMMAEMTKKMKAVSDAAAPKDIVDIFASKPIRLAVLSKEATPVAAPSPAKPAPAAPPASEKTASTPAPAKPTPAAPPASEKTASTPAPAKPTPAAPPASEKTASTPAPAKPAPDAPPASEKTASTPAPAKPASAAPPASEKTASTPAPVKPAPAAPPASEKTASTPAPAKPAPAAPPAPPASTSGGAVPPATASTTAKP